MSDEIEKKESVINYLLNRLRLKDKRANELILTEGEINHYKNVKATLEECKSDMTRDLKIQNMTESKDAKSDQNYVQPTGEGGIRFQRPQDEDSRDKLQKEKEKVDLERAKEIISQCDREIDELEKKLEELNDLQPKSNSSLQ